MDPSQNADALTAAMADVAFEVAEFRALSGAAQRSGCAAAWQKVLDFKSFWNIKNDPYDASVEFMTDDELQKALVEDLLQAGYEEARGALGVYTLAQATRFLDHRGVQQNREAKRRVEDAILALAAGGLIVLHEGEDRLSILADRVKEAQAFAGFYPGLADDDDDGYDMVDTALMAGGPEMLADIFADLGHRVDAATRPNEPSAA